MTPNTWHRLFIAMKHSRNLYVSKGRALGENSAIKIRSVAHRRKQLSLRHTNFVQWAGGCARFSITWDEARTRSTPYKEGGNTNQDDRRAYKPWRVHGDLELSA